MRNQSTHRAVLLVAILQLCRCLVSGSFCTAQELSALQSKDTGNDLATPPATGNAPGPGKRVRQFQPKYVGTGVYHLLYLPEDWKPQGKYPVIVEYAGNRWKTSPGTVEGSNLGYGISAGKGVIWICMPFVDQANKKNALNWWGDVDATVAYCQSTVDAVCRKYGGDRSNLFIAGFSRGAIACNFIGLHNDSIASLWKGFICHSHYDGVREWNYSGSNRQAAKRRLQRLGNRPQFISQEGQIESTRKYLAEEYPDGNVTLLAIPRIGHTDNWVLRPSQERDRLRKWFDDVVKQK